MGGPLGRPKSIGHPVLGGGPIGRASNLRRATAVPMSHGGGSGSHGARRRRERERQAAVTAAALRWLGEKEKQELSRMRAQSTTWFLLQVGAEYRVI